MKRTLYESDHDAYRETVREFLSREVVPHQDDWDRDHWIDREVFARAAKAGIYALQVDETYGGAGEHDYRYRMVVSEEIARINALSFGLTISLQDDLVLHYLLDPTVGDAVAGASLGSAAAAGAGAAGEAVAANAGTDTSAAAQATATSPVSRPGVRAGKCRTFPLAWVRHTPRAGCATRPARSRRLIGTDVIIVSPVTVVGGPLPPGRQSAAPAPIQKGSLPPHGGPSALALLDPL